MRYSRAAKPLKEIFSRMHDGAGADARNAWPLVEWRGHIVWMKGVAVEPELEVPFTVEELPSQTQG